MKNLINRKASGFKFLAMSALCLMISVFTPPPLAGQTNCLSMVDKPDYLASMSPSQLVNNDGPYTLRLYLYNVRHTDGSGGLTQTEINDVLARLENDFSPHNIYFSLACTDDIENSLYKNDPTLLLNSSYVKSQGINLFVSDSNGNGGLAGDFGSNAAYAFILDDFDIPSHEIGHCLGLYHTFHGSPCASDGGTPNDPNDCTGTGDFVCETPPDPRTSLGVQPDCSWDPTTTCNSVVYPDTDPQNMMSYGYYCREYFVDEQGARMRNMIENHPDLAPTQVNEYYIFSDVTWAQDQYVDVDIRVFPPATLTLDGKTLHMAPGRRIIVEKGAYFVAKDATITLDPVSACEESGDFWKGIELRGGTAGEKPAYAGIFRSTIELAETVFYYPLQGALSSYGRVVAADVVFKNNRNTVNFVSSGPQTSFYNTAFPSKFLRSEFTIDQNYPSSAFDTHVVITHVKNIRFQGCTFENDLYQQFGQNETNYAIRSYLSGFEVKGWCNNGYPEDNCPPAQYTASHIRDFRTGIHAIESDGFIVKETLFENMATGINAEASNNFVVVENDFILDDFVGATSLIGLLNDGGTGFSIYDNEFISETESTLNHGIFVIGTGQEPNEIRNNYFEDMRRGIWVVGQNQNSLIPSIGLSMICNEHANFPTGTTDGPYDFRVIFGSTIASLQGAPDNPAGNTFSLNTFPSGSDYRMDVFFPTVDYFFKVNTPGEEPENSFGINLFGVNFSADCQIEGGVLTETDHTDLQNYYLANINSYNSLKQTYDHVIDRGDTPGLVNTVNNASNSFEANAIKNDLLNLAPFVSKEVLAAVHERGDLFSDQSRYDILSVNPDALKTEMVADVVENSTQQLSEPYRTQLINGNYPVTTRTTMESDLAQYKMDANRAINRALQLLSEDTLSTFSQEREWLAKKESFAANLQIANSYFREGLLDSMATYLSALPTQMTLSSDQLAIFQDYSAYLLILRNVLQSNRNFFELDSTELTTLNNVALAGEARPNLAVREFLRIYYDYQFAPSSLAAPDAPIGAAAHTEVISEKEGTAGDFYVSPNPARDQITVQFPTKSQSQGGQLEIRHLTGAIITRIPVQVGQTSLTWNSSHLQEGIYLIILNQEGRQPITRKIIIAN